MKKTIRKIVLSLIACTAIVAGLTNINMPTLSAAGESSLDKIKARGTIVLGTSADYPPYEFHATIDGKDVISGFDIEIAKKIADGLGVELEIKDMAFNGLLAALQTGTVDFVLAGMQATPERKESVDFSIPYFQSNNLIMVKTENAELYTMLSDLSGKKVGVQQGSIQESAAEEIDGVTTRPLTNVLDIIQDLINGNIDAMIIEESIGKNIVKNNPKLTMLSDIPVPSDTTGSSVAVAKGNEELLAAINAILKPIVSENQIEDLYAEADELATNGDGSVKSGTGPFAFLAVYWPMILMGTGITILVAFMGVLFGSILGLLLALIKLSSVKFLQFLVTAYIELIRGTPMLIQISIIFFGLPAFGIKFSPLIAGVIAVSLNSAAYVAEIIRAGINAVDSGQLEAARSLGMNYTTAMRQIIVPQAIKNILPALGNEFITIIKESSIISIIGVGDLMYAANTIRGNTYQPFTPFIVAAIIYFVLTFTLSRVLSKVEGKMNKDVRN